MSLSLDYVTNFALEWWSPLDRGVPRRSSTVSSWGGSVRGIGTVTW